MLMFDQFIAKLENALTEDLFVGMTISKKRSYDDDLEKITVKRVLVSNVVKLQFVYKHQTKDITKNYVIETGIEMTKRVMEDRMKHVHLFTTTGDHVLQQNKKLRWKLYATKPTFDTVPSLEHNKKKFHLVDISSPYLRELGIVNSEHRVNKDKGDKYKQIQKFVEIIADQISELKEKQKLSVVDMGSGKGYLTFALYDFMSNIKKIDAKVKGVEVRPDLISKCNQIADKIGYDHLSFIEGDIQSTDIADVDMLIALHACDTATDDAIYKGIKQNAKWIICSPCCQHQVRKDMTNNSFMKGILKHGILMERMAELLTDGIRSLILEAMGYNTKVFEFISNDHTGKNLIIVAEKSVNASKLDNKWDEIKFLYDKMGIKKHYLHALLE